MTPRIGRKRPRVCPLSPAHLLGLAALELGVALLVLAPALAPLPLAAFVGCCAVGVFVPRFRLFLPVVHRGDRAGRSVALTFDGGPDPALTPSLLALLARASAPAAFFVSGEAAERHPDVVREILAGGHAIGNGSWGGRPSLAAATTATLRREVASTQAALKRSGVVPLAYRPPGGLVRPALWRILVEEGLYCVHWSRRGRATGGRGESATRLAGRVAAGDIIALPGAVPNGATAGGIVAWCETLILGLRERGLDIVPLDRLIGKDVSRPTDSGAGTHPVKLFYDGLAHGYDDEQFRSNVSISKRKEHELFFSRIPTVFSGARRVLEIGAGTGIFTLPIARHCGEVVALDLSPRMLAILERKAKAAGLDNIRTLAGDAEEIALPGSFSVACAFLALEYIADLPAFFRRLAPHVEPGGALYALVARRSLFRLATQLGNAMRQGIWLKAYSRKEIAAMLRAAGFEDIEVKSHLLKSWLSGGMLLEVAARRARNV